MKSIREICLKRISNKVAVITIITLLLIILLLTISIKEINKKQKQLLIIEENIAEIQGKVLSTTNNVEVYDKCGNKIIVPVGFKITKDANVVTNGIVVEDENGNQFVWIPVGKIYTDMNKTEGKTKNIQLARYLFDAYWDDMDNVVGTGNIIFKTELANEDVLEGKYTTKFEEGRIEGIGIDSESTDAKGYAKDIQAFIESVEKYGGYYIARYEARKSGEELTSNKKDSIYNKVTQLEATNLSQQMYKSKLFTSDLVNSFAWDTAIAFIQKCENADYSKKVSVNNFFESKGTNKDKVCNIYDMASNCFEWTTETHSNSTYPCVERSGNYYFYNKYYTSNRIIASTGDASSFITFRPILYLGK